MIHSSLFLSFNFRLIMLILSFLLIQTLQIVPTVPSAYPTVYFDSNRTISTLSTPTSNFANISDFQITDTYIARQSVNGDLRIWSIQTGKLLYEFFTGISTSSIESCIRFAFSLDDTLLAAATYRATTNSQWLVVYNMTANASIICSSQLSQNIINGISIIGNEITILWMFNAFSSNYLNRYMIKGTNLIPLYTYHTLYANKPVNRIKTFETNPVSNNYYVLVWLYQCSFQIYNCLKGTFTACTTYEYHYADYAALCYWNLPVNTTGYKIKITNNGTKLLFHQYMVGLKVYNIASRTFDPTNYSSTIPYNITETAFTDSLNLFIGFTSYDGYYRSIQYNSNNTAIQYTYQIMTSPILFSQFSSKYNKFIIANDTMILTFSLTCNDPTMKLVNEGYCIQCPLNCTQCTYQGVCTLCQANFNFIYSNNICQYVPPPSSVNVTQNQTDANSSSSSNTSNASSSNTNTSNNTSGSNSTNNNLQNYPANNPNNTVVPDSPNNTLTQQNQASNQTKTLITTIKPIQSFEDIIGKYVHQNLFDKVMNLVFNIIMLLKILPFAFVFIKFINFWSICSFYLLLGVPLPEHLSDTLNIIYQKINDSIFDKIGLPTGFNFNPDKKITGFLSESYNLSSDFIDTNFENFCLLLISYTILLMFYVLKMLLPSSNLFARMFSTINYEMAILGQFVAMMGSFFTNMWFVEGKSYQTTFYEKLNMPLEFFFVALSLTVIGWAFLIIQKQPESQVPKQYKSIEQNAWLVAWLCNSLVPSLAVFQKILLFYVFNLALFVFGTYAAHKQIEFRVNSMILSLELVAFHIGFGILLIFDADNFPKVYHFTGLCMIILLFLGAVHEILTFFCSIFFYLYTVLCLQTNSISSVKPIDFTSKNKENINSSFNQSQIEKENQHKSFHFLPKFHKNSKSIEHEKFEISKVRFDLSTQTTKLSGFNIRAFRQKKQLKKSDKIKRVFQNKETFQLQYATMKKRIKIKLLNQNGMQKEDFSNTDLDKN